MTPAVIENVSCGLKDSLTLIQNAGLGRLHMSGLQVAGLGVAVKKIAEKAKEEMANVVGIASSISVKRSLPEND